MNVYSASPSPTAERAVSKDSSTTTDIDNDDNEKIYASLNREAHTAWVTKSLQRQASTTTRRRRPDIDAERWWPPSPPPGRSSAGTRPKPAGSFTDLGAIGRRRARPAGRFGIGTGGDSTHLGGWASGLRFKNALINPIGFTGGIKTGLTPALDGGLFGEDGSV